VGFDFSWIVKKSYFGQFGSWRYAKQAANQQHDQQHLEHDLELPEKEAGEFSVGAEVTCFTEVAYRFFITWLDSEYSRYAWTGVLAEPKFHYRSFYKRL